MAIGSITAGGLTFDSINSSVGSALSTRETELKDLIASTNGKAGGPDTTDLLLMQQGLTRWSMTTQIQTTMVKELGDAMKGVIQKAG
jgi:type III secretion protein F